VFRRSGVTMQVRSLPAIERFFDGLELIDPGLVPLPRWPPGHRAEVGEASLPSDAAVSVYGGVARKP
jgi:S-adenosyl methyltransferase